MTESAIFLRWLPHHGFPILVLVAVATSTAAAIYLTQRQRYKASSHSISRESADADIPLCSGQPSQAGLRAAGRGRYPGPLTRCSALLVRRRRRPYVATSPQLRRPEVHAVID
ncbi:hypothetical protein [Arthrobacter sp. W4I7]|uniref:hypothetical protein n=1 Tax=Arthrobacter sp. W4I7 TaxID=3042296 RepID=UPI0027D814E8|nr:hypothetical protein [Arthrobacter sp. W4I7]